MRGREVDTRIEVDPSYKQYLVVDEAPKAESIRLSPAQVESVEDIASQMQAIEKVHGELKVGLQVLLNHFSRELSLPKDKRYTLSPDRKSLIEVKE